VSNEFESWKNDDNKVRELLEGSHVFTEPFDKNVAWKGWEKGRRFILLAINKDGSILDYGCANGFLLRSLQEWSEHKLEPYGLDIDEKAIAKAKELFQSNADHFVTPEEIQKGKDFPKYFDFVYWNVWDNWKFERPEETDLLKKLQTVTKRGGRLILGFYDTRGENLKRNEQLKQLGFAPDEIIENPNGEGMLVIFNQSIS